MSASQTARCACLLLSVTVVVSAAGRGSYLRDASLKHARATTASVGVVLAQQRPTLCNDGAVWQPAGERHTFFFGKHELKDCLCDNNGHWTDCQRIDYRSLTTDAVLPFHVIDDDHGRGGGEGSPDQIHVGDVTGRRRRSLRTTAEVAVLFTGSQLEHPCSHLQAIPVQQLDSEASRLVSEPNRKLGQPAHDAHEPVPERSSSRARLLSCVPVKLKLRGATKPRGGMSVPPTSSHDEGLDQLTMSSAADKHEDRPVVDQQ